MRSFVRGLRGSFGRVGSRSRSSTAMSGSTQARCGLNNRAVADHQADGRGEPYAASRHLGDLAGNWNSRVPRDSHLEVARHLENDGSDTKRPL
jgi:hypothetical protein